VPFCGLLQDTHLLNLSYLSVRAEYTSRDLAMMGSGHDGVSCSPTSEFIGGLGTDTHQETGTEKESEEKREVFWNWLLRFGGSCGAEDVGEGGV